MAAAVASILKYLENNNQDYPMDQNIEIPHQRAKKRRLDHLTWEEKIQRKKLKNRVAAQTSRDRKKAKMEQMENAIQQLFSKNESLMAECESLKLDNQRLSQENQELFNRLRAPCVSCSQNRSVACEAPGSTASACPTSSSAQDRLQQRGGATHSAAALTATPTAAPATPTITPRSAHLLRALSRTILLTCLLCRTSSTSWNATRRPGRAATGRPSTGRNSNSSRKAYLGTSPGILRQLHRRLNVMNPKEIDKIVIEKWWGRHQRSWNPVDVKS
ncbi:unnamed protein product [Acanthoscelides obtectus]|uniref:X-box-binding protein 1 n=1 Tax=Acanthoscelides obtectus TaxID=200917 RepID=A0A9P0KBM4_ACAOB|nr:unnamed protein product [Acanthoscelides obtectus]CAK1622760.1 X-box-binding protein 1 [Acanthoscelides obtectus]